MYNNNTGKGKIKDPLLGLVFCSKAGFLSRGSGSATVFVARSIGIPPCFFPFFSASH